MRGLVYRLFNVLLAAIYALLFHYIFINYVTEYFSRLNTRAYYPIPMDQMKYYILLSALPLFFYKGLKTIASALSLFTFLFAYIPIINAFYGFRYSSDITIPYSILFFIAMICFFLTDDIFIFKSFYFRKKRGMKIEHFELLVWLGFIVVALINIRQIQFVNFLEDSDDLYELRASNSIKGVYMLCWLRSAFFPFLMVLYLKRKEYFKYILSIFAFMVIFMLDKQKITFIFPFVLFGMYKLVVVHIKIVVKYFHAFLMVILLGISLLLMQFLNNSFIFSLAPVMIMRTLCIETMELERYINFFEIQSNPYTYFSHVGFINFFTNSYPYPDTMGRMVAGNGSCANATFWLMDGIGGGGIVGCIVISLIFIIFKSIMNSLSLKCHWLLCIIMMLFSIMSMLNLSLFISINTCGFIILFLIMYFVKAENILLR